MGDVILEYDEVSGVNGQAVFDCILMFALLIFACNVRASTSKMEKIGFSLSKYPEKDQESLLSYIEKYGGEKIDGDESVEYNYSFFHFVMFLASLQLMMTATNWHSPDDRADLKKLVKNWATVWIQLSSSFLCVLMYIWATVTPLLVRTWGPCLGLDYEPVPTEDDDERRQRRRRRRILEHDAINRHSKFDKVTYDRAENGRGITHEDDAGREKLKNLNEQDLPFREIQEDFCNAARDGSRVENSTAKNGDEITGRTNEQTHGSIEPCKYSRVGRAGTGTEDSGVHDDSSLTTFSTARDISKSAEHSVHVFESEQRRRSEALREQWSSHETLSEDKKRRKSKDYDVSGVKICERKTTSNLEGLLEYDSHKSLNETKTDIKRPLSAIALASDRNLREDFKQNESIFPKRPMSCQPSLRAQEEFSTKRGREMVKTSSRQIDHKNLDRTLDSEGDKMLDVKLKDTATHDDNELNKSFTRTQKDFTSQENIHVVSGATKIKECKSLGNGDSEVLPDKLKKSRSQSNMAPASVRKPLEKDSRPTLQMRDHLKWVRSLKGFKSKETLEKRRKKLAGKRNLFSFDVDLCLTAKDKNINDKDEEVTRKEVESQNGQVSGAEGNTSLKEKCSSIRRSEDKMIESINKAGQENKDENSKSNEIENILENEQNINTIEKCEQAASVKDETKITPHCLALQTPDVSKEILRIQQKILKFQAKIVKTQQKINEMQQDL